MMPSWRGNLAHNDAEACFCGASGGEGYQYGRCARELKVRQKRPGTNALEDPI